MKYFEFLSLSSVGLCIACGDLLLAVSILGPSSFYLYLDFMDIEKWEQDAEVEALTPIGTFFSTLVNYLWVREFSQVFYMTATFIIWVKAMINLMVACILIDGIKQKRLVCIAPWLINSCLSMVVETGIFVSLELRIDEVDAAVDRRIARSLIFGVFIVLNALVSYGIYALYRKLKSEPSENLEVIPQSPPHTFNA
ncbi:uncharacterized protein LOC27208462 isoform X1 [Drosophila simulans]|uniref:uncharacterized protein LOC27208462 isoform X1 n=1 Tax=Drosophila simulans TaxID=7240 RepID=UPI00078AEAC6|nr:uncharacterized protein LOC27208462 isoform X1 [Drosophila simulans]KMZ02613.1 uncharacterized protein Dsimw501_GD28615, isoform A [Drosophila simulans]KMZ02614.1 uncharacterized protein Dsimw501_GD28615, isoform B [Drosophila simulans]